MRRCRRISSPQLNEAAAPRLALVPFPYRVKHASTSSLELELMTAPLSWPRKTRELRNHHLDSSIWNHFRYRPGDVIIASYPKSGTTWTQQIVGQLLSSGAEFPINQVS